MEVNSTLSLSAKAKLWVGAQHDLDDISARHLEQREDEAVWMEFSGFEQEGVNVSDPSGSRSFS